MTLPGRKPIERQAPVTREDFYSRAYAAQFRLDGMDSETVPQVVELLKQSAIPVAQLEADRAAAFLVQDRCAVSRARREFLDLALASMAA